MVRAPASEQRAPGSNPARVKVFCRILWRLGHGLVRYLTWPSKKWPKSEVVGFPRKLEDQKWPKMTKNTKKNQFFLHFLFAICSSVFFFMYFVVCPSSTQSIFQASVKYELCKFMKTLPTDLRKFRIPMNYRKSDNIENWPLKHVAKKLLKLESKSFMHSPDSSSSSIHTFFKPCWFFLGGLPSHWAFHLEVVSVVNSASHL